jgi:hypothetical protein
MHAFTLLAGIGVVALSLALLFGFEEANRLLLWVAAALLVAAPAAVLGRLVTSPTLTRKQKRAWLRALFGRRALRAWSLYLRRLEH